MKPAVAGGLVVAGLVTLVVLVVLLAGDARDPDAAHAENVVFVDVSTSRYAFAPGTAAPIEVPLGSVVVFRVTSTDVTHGFAILEYGVSIEVPPGETVEVRVVADRAGAFTIFCTVFCGAGHAEHKGTLHVA